MSGITAKGGADKVEISAVVTRADGRVDDFGVVASTRKAWRFGPSHVFSVLKIKRANRRIGFGN